MYCWLLWWLSISVPRPPNPEYFSALISGGTYPSPFLTQTILPTQEAFAPLSLFKSFLGQGYRAQLTGQPHLPWCLLAPTATTSQKQMGNGWPKPALCSPPHVKCALPYTHHTLSRHSLSLLFPPVGFTASQLCLVKIITFLDFWGCLWISESI